MNLLRLYRLSDKTLKALSSNKFQEPIKYETNTIDDKVTLSDDFFKKIGISQTEIPFVITLLTQSGFIKIVNVGGDRREVSHDLHKEFKHSVSQIILKNEGTIFIKSGSFVFDYYKNWITKWIPLILSLLSFAFSIYFNLPKKTDTEKEQSTNMKIESLTKRLDSLLLSFPLQANSVDTLSDTSSQK